MSQQQQSYLAGISRTAVLLGKEHLAAEAIFALGGWSKPLSGARDSPRRSVIFFSASTTAVVTGSISPTYVRWTPR